ncbi:MAG: SulP family inorganic anion transporter [Desulfocapsaceae bacterium]
MKRQFINRSTILEDLSAGVVLGIQSVPSGLANGLLALVNPIYGLHAYMMGVFTGAFFTSSTFMSVQGTSAMALVVASVPQVTQGSYPNTALFALAILTGVFMLLAGLFNLGSLLRFVPNSVMTGFINAVALLIILGQLDDFTGYDSLGGNRLTRTINLLQNTSQFHLPTLLIGALTIILILTLEKTRLKALGMVVAMVISSFAANLLGADAVALVRDIAEIPGSLPWPALPQPAVFPYLILPALSMTFVGLMQGASITQSVPNPDGRYPNASGDFIGQGMANLVSGLFQGTTVGGSISATAIVTSAGARSRFANITAGIVIALVIVLFGRLVGLIAMPALAGLLIVVGFRTLKPAEIVMVWKTGLTQDAVMVLTFAAALLVPLQYAVLLGVGLAVLLFVFQQSNKIAVKAWKIEPGQYPVEGEPPAVVPPKQVTILVPYGSLFYAAAPVFNSQLPEVTEASQHAAVILALRGKKDVGSTFLQVVTRYAKGLQRRNSKLMLVGIAPNVLEQMERTGILRTIGRQNVFMATEGVGQALLQAVDAAEGWIAAQPSGR